MKRKIIPKQKYTTYASFPLVSGDVRAYEIELDLGQSVTGAEFKVVAIRADGKAIEDLGVVSDGVATYTLANSMYAVPGELTVRLQVLQDSSVLTDREIIFEVLEGTQNASQGSTVVPLNDSIILRLSSLEDKIEGKVNKVAGKDLSQNDFTNEYKAKLDGLDETIGAELEKVSEELGRHKNDQTNPHNVTAEQVGAYTKSQVDTKLEQKANKSIIYTTTQMDDKLAQKADKADIVGKKGLGDLSVIMNDLSNNTASGYASFTAGYKNKTTKDQGITFGYGNENHGMACFVTGALNKVYNSGNRDTVFGANNVVEGSNKFVAGTNLWAMNTSDGSIVLGKYNEDVQDAIFIVGTGDDIHRRNALVIDKSGNIIAYGTLTIDKNTTVNGTLDVNDNVTVKGNIKGDNIFPKDINFVINGDITNQNGTLVAKYDGTNVNFSLNPTEYPYDDRRIRDCRTLIIPIEPVTLQAGTYNKTGTYSVTPGELSRRLADNEYYLKLFTDEVNGVTEKDDIYIVSKPITIDAVYLQTDKVWETGDKYYSWEFVGSGCLDLSAVQLTDITAGFIGAVEEHKEADGVSTSLHLTSPNGTVFKLTVADDGSLTTIKV